MVGSQTLYLRDRQTSFASMNLWYLSADMVFNDISGYAIRGEAVGDFCMHPFLEIRVSGLRGRRWDIGAPCPALEKNSSIISFRSLKNLLKGSRGHQ